MSDGDWWGSVTDHDINVRFRQVVLEFARHVTGDIAVQVYVCDDLPPQTVGMIGGKPCMSRDLHEDAQEKIGKINPEDN